MPIRKQGALAQAATMPPPTALSRAEGIIDSEMAAAPGEVHTFYILDLQNVCHVVLGEDDIQELVRRQREFGGWAVVYISEATYPLERRIVISC